MKYVRGSMSGGAMIALAIVAFMVLVVMTAIGSYVSYANMGNRLEVALKAKKEDNKNIFGQYGQKVLEVAQVPGMARDDLVKVTTAAIEGRYGPNGSQAVFQMIREVNPTIDGALYRQIQQVIEAGRNEFQNGQKGQIDQLRNYETLLGNVWSGFWLRLAGYPKTDLSQFKIITTDRADEVYQRGKESGPIQLR